MVKYLKTFCLIFIISNFLLCDPYKQLDIDFLKNSKKKSIKKTPSAVKKPKSSLPKLSEIVKDFEKISGLWDFYFKEDDNKLLLALEPKHFE